MEELDSNQFKIWNVNYLITTAFNNLFVESFVYTVRTTPKTILPLYRVIVLLIESTSVKKLNSLKGGSVIFFNSGFTL